MKKDRVLRIRCCRDTEKKFKRFVIDSEAPTSEQALLDLLDTHERFKKLWPGRPSRIALEPMRKA